MPTPDLLVYAPDQSIGRAAGVLAGTRNARVRPNRNHAAAVRAIDGLPPMDIAFTIGTDRRLIDAVITQASRLWTGRGTVNRALLIDLGRSTVTELGTIPRISDPDPDPTSPAPDTRTVVIAASDRAARDLGNDLSLDPRFTGYVSASSRADVDYRLRGVNPRHIVFDSDLDDDTIDAIVDVVDRDWRPRVTTTITIKEAIESSSGITLGEIATVEPPTSPTVASTPSPSPLAAIRKPNMLVLSTGTADCYTLAALSDLQDSHTLRYGTPTTAENARRIIEVVEPQDVVIDATLGAMVLDAVVDAVRNEWAPMITGHINIYIGNQIATIPLRLHAVIESGAKPTHPHIAADLHGMTFTATEDTGMRLTVPTAAGVQDFTLTPEQAKALKAALHQAEAGRYFDE